MGFIITASKSPNEGMPTIVPIYDTTELDSCVKIPMQESKILYYFY